MVDQPDAGGGLQPGKAAASAPASAGIEAVTEAREGQPADVLCDIAEAYGSDVIVVGNRGMHRKVLGSVPNSVSHNAPCSVVIVKTT